MTVLELAVTIFVYGAVVAGAVLTLCVANLLIKLANRAEAQAAGEERLH